MCTCNVGDLCTSKLRPQQTARPMGYHRVHNVTTITSRPTVSSDCSSARRGLRRLGCKDGTYATCDSGHVCSVGVGGWQRVRAEAAVLQHRRLPAQLEQDAGGTSLSSRGSANPTRNRESFQIPFGFLIMFSRAHLYHAWSALFRVPSLSLFVNGILMFSLYWLSE